MPSPTKYQKPNGNKRSKPQFVLVRFGRTLRCGPSDQPLLVVRHVVTENERVLQTVEKLKERGPKAIGDLMNASHVSMRDDFEISVDELDEAVSVAQNFGAIGARMTGGGFGGAAIALVPTELISELTVAIRYAFKKRGFIEPTIFSVTAADGAHRLS